VEEDKERVARFLTAVGKEHGAPPAATMPQREQTKELRRDGNPVALRNVLRTLVRPPEAPAFSLPRCLTGAAAVSYLVNLKRP
jgi:hypothetical protein